MSFSNIFSRALFRPLVRTVSLKLETTPLTVSTRNLALTASTLSADPKVPASVWSLGRLNHVAIATPNLEKSVSLYRDVLGAKVRQVQELLSFLKLRSTLLLLCRKVLLEFFTQCVFRSQRIWPSKLTRLYTNARPTTLSLNRHFSKFN